MLGFQLTPDQVEIQKTAREFALKEILPVAWHYDAVDDTPIPVLRKAWETGIMNCDIPRQYGGKGYGLLENVLITEDSPRPAPAWRPRSSTTPSAWTPAAVCQRRAEAKVLPADR